MKMKTEIEIYMITYNKSVATEPLAGRSSNTGVI